MNFHRVDFFLTLLFFLLKCFGADNQTVLTDSEELDLAAPGRAIENSIDLYISEPNYDAVKSITGKKIKVEALSLKINGTSLEPDKINTRGQTTLYYRRKSFSFSVGSRAEFNHAGQTQTFRKFIALSLSMDRNYSNNRLAFEMMDTCGLFKLFYAFCELRINNRSEGIYMIVERPEDWAVKKKDSPLLIRRGYKHVIEKIITDKKTQKTEIRNYCSNYYNIYKNLGRYQGEDLYNSLNQWLDIDFYMKWLAFNFIVRNGDYTDEVYFYFDPVIRKFRIIPWDYDDLFHSAPHEGNVATSQFSLGKFIFSTEDLLDKKIATDPYLYKAYLNQMKELLNQLSPAVLKRIFENTYGELYPYFLKNEIMDMSSYDAYKNTNLERLQNDLTTVFGQVRLSAQYYLKQLSN